MSTTATETTTLGFVGLGAMGYPMSGHLRSRCKRLIVWNRTRTVSERHRNEFESIVMKCPSELAKENPDVIFFCLPTSDVVRSVVEDMKDFIRPGTVLVDCTSGDPAITKKISDELESKGIVLIDAPVSGGPRGAKAGTLTVMMGGPEKAVRSIRELILSSFGKAATRVGNVGSGHATKSLNNALNVTQLCMASEGLLRLREKYGVEPGRALEMINKSSGRSLQTQERIPGEVLTQKFSYGFKIGLMLKDVRIAKTVSDNSVYFQRTEKLLEIAVERFGADADYTAVVKVLRNASGVTLSETATLER